MWHLAQSALRLSLPWFALPGCICFEADSKAGQCKDLAKRKIYWYFHRWEEKINQTVPTVVFIRRRGFGGNAGKDSQTRQYTVDDYYPKPKEHEENKEEWRCPGVQKCKTEYIEGIDICADCRTPLVASLKNGSSPEKPGGTQDLQEEEPDHLYDSRKLPDETAAVKKIRKYPSDGDELSRQLSRHTVAYVKPDEQYKDYKIQRLYADLYRSGRDCCDCPYCCRNYSNIARSAMMQDVFAKRFRGILFCSL